MKKVLIMIMCILILTGCKAENGNKVSKLETTIYKSLNHSEMVIEDAFDYLKKEFLEKDTFYHASLLTIEYGDESTEELRKIFRKKYQLMRYYI